MLTLDCDVYPAQYDLQKGNRNKPGYCGRCLPRGNLWMKVPATFFNRPLKLKLNSDGGVRAHTHPHTQLCVGFAHFDRSESV